MLRSDHIRRTPGRTRRGILLLACALLLGAADAARADDCSQYPGGVLDGFAGTVAPSQLKIDQNCTIRNYPASNPFNTNISFATQPGQTDQRWLVIFDNVVHTGQMACNAVAGHKIWFVNGSSTSIKDGCQNLLIPVEKIVKENPAGQTTAAIGVPFTYKLTIPVLFDPGTGTIINTSGSPNDLHSVTIWDDLNETGVDLTYLSHVAYWEGSGTPVPHTFSNDGGRLTFDVAPIIPAGQQIVIEITAVLQDTPTNVPGTQFINTAKWDFGRLIDGVFYEPLPGEWGISPPLTIAAPQLVVTKTGPATLGRTLNLGEWGQFGLDVRNTGLGDAWNVTLVDRLPDGATGGMCDTTPELLSAQVFAADGVTAVPGKGPLVAGTDYTLAYSGAPTCELTLTLLTPAGTIGANQRLIVSYRSRLDADSQDGATLTNVAGATQWFNGDSSATTRVTFSRTLTDGTPGVLDHQDAHTVTVGLHGYFFEKTVADLTSGASPATTAAPGDTLRYTLRFQATDQALDGFALHDDLGALSPTAVFASGSLALVSLPSGADASQTNPNGGTNGAGVLDIRNLSVPANGQVVVQFDVRVSPSAADGSVAINQASLLRGGLSLALSDDPTVNGQADPNVAGDEDPTRVAIQEPPPIALQKANTQATAAVGVPFRYRITVPATPYAYPMYDVRITDDLTASAADLRFLSVTKVSGSQPWTPVNTGSDTQLVIEDRGVGIDIPAGEQVVVEITVVLDDTPTNAAGLAFTNTADYTFERADADPASQRPGAPGTTPAMTIVEPSLTLQKSGPASMTIGTPGSFGLDVHNPSQTPAWNPVLVDRLPDGATGGTCDAAPTALTAQLFQADGTTPVSAPLVPGTDFTVAFAGAPSCQLTLTFLTAASAIGPDQRLIVRYQTSLDADTRDGVTLTNVAGATQWFSADPAAQGRRSYARTLTDGTPNLLDYQDAHAVVVALPAYLFEKTVSDLTSGASPAATATPGDRLRYRLRFANQGTTPLSGLALYDELDALNAAAAFQPGTLQLVTVPAGADASGTSATGGAKGTGVLDLRNLSVPGPGELVVEFEIALAPALANGTVVANQSQLRVGGATFARSDDPNVNGPADPFVNGDEDPTRLLIQSAPVFRVEKLSTDVTGDPNVLLAGETLRYALTVKNVGTADASNVSLRDAVPANTRYVAGSTTLNGSPVPDGPGGSSPLASGIAIHAPGDSTPGVMRADATASTGNVATIVFDVVVDPTVPDGTVLSNQGFVSAPDAGIFDRPSDDPTTPIADDPTRDVVGNTPLLFAPKQVSLLVDAGAPGVVDPGDVLHYTITVYNNGAVPATAVVLSDAVPANTTYVADSTTLNGLPVGRPDGGAAPLAAGVPIASSDLTPPLPGPGGGTVSPGHSAVLAFDLQVNAGVPGGTIISNQAVVRSAELPGLPTDGDGNPATGPEPTRVVVGDGQQLAISKEVAVVGGGAALPGAQVEYLVRVTNIAAVPAYSVVITDDLAASTPGALAFVPGSATMNGSTTGVAVVGTLVTADYAGTYGPLPPGGSIALRFRAVIDAGLALGTTVANLGVVTWNTPPQTASAAVAFDVGGVPGVGTLAGHVWHDADFDRVLDAGERVLEGWSVELYRNGAALQSVQSDASGAYRISGVPPSTSADDRYELRFLAPGAGARTAKLGRGDSPFTNGLQQIRDIAVASGGNLQNLNLPIAPNGVVYGALTRAPVAGATLSLLGAGSTPLPALCFDDPVQQGQATLADGYYRFDLNFSDPACPSGGSYQLEVTPPGSGFTAGYSQLIPPSSTAAAPLSVPTCPVDAVPATPGFCEAQPSELAPPTSVPPRSAGTAYYVHLVLDDSQVPGSSQIFNNHLPVDPVLDGSVAITKTTPMQNVSRGQLVPYEITVRNALGAPIPDLGIVDSYPAGFRYVEGSARIDGAKAEPTVAGRQLTWANVGLAASDQRTLRLLLAVGAGVSEGEFVNRAQAVSTLTGAPLSGEASATVRVTTDPTFACTDVLGKVFDDANANGLQDKGERGLPGVRVATARGLVATTDLHGLFHITCALVPREDRGSNFVLKLDDRTLPSGYRMTTREVQIERATQGKALRVHFGASIRRVVGLDLADAVFEPDTTAMRPQWQPRLGLLIDQLAKADSILRLSYVADVEEPGLVDRRLDAVKQQIQEAWQSRGSHPLEIETEVFWRRGEPPKRAGARLLDPASWESLLPSVDAGPPLVESQPTSVAERQLPTDEPYRQWTQDPAQLATEASDSLEQREVLSEQTKTVKLTKLVPPIHFESGVAQIPASYVAKLRGILDGMRQLRNVRLHLVGHADDQPLSNALSGVYGDNQGLSRERAGEVAEFLQTALGLPPEAVSFSWAGDSQPIASNATPEGRAQNRRVEVEVWYDELEKKPALDEVVVPQEFKRFKVCRTERVCKLRYREGHERRARLRNLIAPLHVGEEAVDVPEDFVRQVAEAVHDLQGKGHLTLRFIGFTDDAPLTGRAERIYGTPLALSKAMARRVALAIQDSLHLPSAAIESDGRGAEQPVASNATERGRALNRRVEVEFWHDDPLQELADEPQPCPDAGGADVVTKVYDPPWGRIAPVPIEEGSPALPPGLTDDLRRAMADVHDKAHVRLRFVGYTRNETLERRTALVYGDDVGLSTARARRTLEEVRAALGLSEAQVEHEGRGYVHADDVVNAGFVQGDASYVAVQVVYDELAALDDDGVEVTPLTRELRPKDPLALNLMRITVDGVPIDDPDRSSADVQRCTDVALERADLQFRFDDLAATPRLSVTAQPASVPVGAEPREAGKAGAAPVVRFRLYTNYPYFIERSEVRIFERGQSVEAEPLAVVPVGRDGLASWRPPAERFEGPARELAFVLRAYDAEGRFDETAPQSLWLVRGEPSEHAEADRKLLAGYGESGPLARHIPLGNVGSVRVQGHGIPPEHGVWLGGVPVPVDEHGSFVAEAILPSGLETVEVAVLDPAGNGELFLRDLELRRSDWFYVGMADLTLSQGLGGGTPGALVGKDAPFDPDSLADGRLAFYLNGKFGEDWRLVASADTREEPVKDLFSNFLDKSPESLFRRIDPDYHYPTFGDDGTVDEAAPTSGKFFVKLAQGENHALWGNFKVGYLDNELAHVDRGLYGGNVHYQSLATTSFGEQRVSLDGFAAEPGTLPSREEFRSTGGSLYFLRRQDILVGSERVRIEIRDKDSGLVTSVVQLRSTLDYEIDYLQGRILLSEPLASTVDDALLVRTGGLSGGEPWLVVQYEYTPGFDKVDALSTGGEASSWLTSFLKLGLTANHNQDGDTDSNLFGANLTMRATDASWLKLQAGRSEGLVSTSAYSEDGGFQFFGTGASALTAADANAYRADLSVSAADLLDGARGRLSLYLQRLDAGYSAPGMSALTDTDQYGGTLGVPLTDRLQLTAKADRRIQDHGLATTAQEVDLGYHVTERWSVGTGVRNEDRNDDSPVVPVTQEEGSRTDAVTQVAYDSKASWRGYGFAQTTLAKSGDREDNRRLGIGGSYRVNERLLLDGEVSEGDLGPGVKLGTRYQQTEGTQYYLRYAFGDDERGFDGLHERRGTLISGAKSRLSDSSSVYLEDRYQHGDAGTGLARAMGINLAPTDHWNLGANWEFGTLVNSQTYAETRRKAGGARLGYAFDDDLRLTSGIEYRFDEAEQLDGKWTERTTWLFRNTLRWQLTPDGRLVGKLNHSFSDSSLGQFYDGGFTEAVLGYAYRPLWNDRLHALAKYTYFYNVPTTDQLSPQNGPALYLQKSHVAALDFTYDVTERWSVGGKYAFRLGQVSIDREHPDFFDSNAHLLIVRNDFRPFKDWEGSVEGRLLELPDLSERRSGALVAVYRYLGDHFKIGVGYNFTDFSEDLTDLSYDHHGVFFNLVGAM